MFIGFEPNFAIRHCAAMMTMENREEKMSETVESVAAGDGKPATPWHLWLVGVLATIWNSGGAVDYTMTQTRNESYMS